MNLGHLNNAQRLSAGAIVVVVVAAFLPWVSVFGIGALGIEGDGVITLICALAGAAVLAVTTGLFGEQKTPGKGANIAMIVLAAITALIGLIDMNSAAAIGLYLTLFAGLAWLGGAVWQLALAKQGEADPTVPPTDGA